MTRELGRYHERYLWGTYTNQGAEEASYDTFPTAMKSFINTHRDGNTQYPSPQLHAKRR